LTFGPDWLHEVKYDGYRMMLIREQDRVPPNQQGRAWLGSALSADRHG
jgi:hypothetical protein